MSNAIKQTNDGFNSIYKGNFSIGINDIAYGGTAVTGFWPTTPATAATGNVLVVYMPKAADGPSIYEPAIFDTVTAFNQYRSSLEGPFITTSGFTTTQNITIPAGTTASTYPLEFNVTGLDKTTNFVTLTLGILSGSNVQNLGIVLVAPDNTTYALIKGSLAGTQSTSGEISVNISKFSGIVTQTGTWDGYSGGNWDSRNSNGSLGLTFDTPCPVGPFSASTNYDGMLYFDNLVSGDTNGTWSLYIQDFGGDNSTLLYAKLSFTFNAMMQQNECLNWAASNDDILVLNREYPSITVDSLQLLVDPWYLPSANAYASSTTALTKVSDLTNNNNDATTTNGVNLQVPNYDSWALFNNPFTFDTVTNIPAGNSAYTTSVWFKTSYNGQALVSFGTDTSYAANYLYVNGSGYIDNYWSGSTITSTGSTINDNNWHNAVVTYDGTIATIYIDGVFDTDLTVGTSLSVSPTSNLEIAGGGNQSDFDGNMGPVMIYNRALTSTEVLNNYNNVLSTHGY
jgi:hypothetical protein